VSDGATHYAYYKRGYATLPAVTAVLWLSTIFYYWEPVEQALRSLLFASFLYLLGRWVDPDLDQAGTSSADSRMVKEIPILGYFLYLYWTAYALSMSALARLLRVSAGHLGAHRTWLTHSYLGTLIRVGYFNIPVIAGLMLTGFHPPLLSNYLAGMVIAFAYADSIHYRLDRRETE
jgi:uncharacterized membrane protein